MALNLDKTITWLPPTNSNVSNFRTEFDRIYGNFSELNDVHPRIQSVEETLLLTEQTMEAGLTANTPVYFDAGENQWKRYYPSIRQSIPSLFLGSNTVALSGALVNLTHSGNILYINEQGGLAATLPSTHMSQRKSLGYRVGGTLFKIEYKQHPGRLREPTERITTGISGSNYGSPVSMHGDTLVVGAGCENSCNGVTYVYRFTGGYWRQEARVYPSGLGQDDYFGASVDIEDDLMISSSPNYNGAGTNTGAVFVYRKDASGWQQEKVLYAADPQAGMHFGQPVSLSGDVIAASGYGDGTNGSEAGAVYIFRHNGSDWIQETKLYPEDPQAGQQFGYTLKLEGDLLFVGAHGDDYAGATSGAAYVFRYTNGEWVQEAKLHGSDEAAGDTFGIYVSYSQGKLAVGALKRDENKGAVYMFRYDGTNWNEEHILTADDGAVGDYLGYRVALWGDTMAVTASAWEGSNGAVYIYRFDGSNWIQESKFVAYDRSSNTQYGGWIDLLGDTMVAGSPYAGTTGAIYINDISE